MKAQVQSGGGGSSRGGGGLMLLELVLRGELRTCFGSCSRPLRQCKGQTKCREVPVLICWLLLMEDTYVDLPVIPVTGNQKISKNPVLILDFNFSKSDGEDQHTWRHSPKTT